MEAMERDIEIVRRMTPARKLAVLTSLIRQAWELKAGGIRTLRPDLCEEEVQARARAMVGGDRP
jgi:hypothetical protein